MATKKKTSATDEVLNLDPQTETDKEVLENSEEISPIPETETSKAAKDPVKASEKEAEGANPDGEEVKNEPLDLVVRTALNSNGMTVNLTAEGPHFPVDSGVKAPRQRKSKTIQSQSTQSTTEGKEHKKTPGLRVISIDERRTVVTDEDKAKNDLLDLIESEKTGKILSGTIQGVEMEAYSSAAVIYRGAYKILIPAEEAVEPPEDFRGHDPKEVFHYLLTKRLGAEVDYIVKGIDKEAKIAVASRLDAMKAKRKQYYFGVDRDGNNILYADVCTEARVVSVIRAGIFIELFGLECYIPIRELSYQRIMDASGQFQPGMRVLVKILGIDRSDRNRIRVTASVKQASENPYTSAIRRYTVGNRYVGTVSMVDANGVFVALDGGVDCLCSFPKRGRPPRGARATVRILGINRESNRIWGAITHTAMPR